MTHVTVAALLAQAASFWLVAHGLADAPVTSTAWWVLYLLGATGTAVMVQRWPHRLQWRFCLEILLYAALLAAVFFGADFALDALGNSVKPRLQGPAFPGGLELYHLLFPGLASVAFGALVASLPVRSRRHPPERSR